MTPAEKRIKDQIDRWLVSLDLHLQYVDLNDLAYNRMQPWPVHDRPTRLVLDLAKQKTLELKAAFEARSGAGDTKFAESLELMSFLANLIGSQHVQRFIPLADPERAPASSAPPVAAASNAALSNSTQSNQAQLNPAKSTPVASAPVASAPVQAPKAVAAPVAAAPVAPKPAATEPAVTSATMAPTVIMPHKPAAKKDDDDATREMPKPQRAKPTPPPAPAKPAPKAEAKNKPAAKGDAPNEAQLQIITDAVRLINWGRPWHELAEAIARMADRPPAGEIRRILRTHRAEIERRAEKPQS